MTLPVFKAAGTMAHNTGMSTVAWPTHAAGDFGVMFIEHPNNSIDVPSGWTLLARAMPNNNTSSRLTAFYKFAASSSEPNVTLTGTATDHTDAVILTWTGVNTGSPIHSISVGTNVLSSTTLYAPGLATFLDDCLIINAFCWNLDNAGPLSSGETNGDLSSLTERFDGGTTDGNGGGVVVIEGALATHATIRPTKITLGSAIGGECPCMTFALQDAGRSLPSSRMNSRIVNTGM